jgi:hypothetical protein
MLNEYLSDKTDVPSNQQNQIREVPMLFNYLNLKHNGPGHGIYAHLSYHIDFEIALKYHIILGYIPLDYRVSYRV